MPYRDVVDPTSGRTVRVGWTKYLGGRRTRTKRASLAYWAARTDRGKELLAMATKKAAAKGTKTSKRAWERIPSDLNLWKPKRVGEAFEGMVISTNPKGKYGLQVKMVDEHGVLFTMPSHMVLQNRMEGVLAKVKGKRALVRIEYTGEGKSAANPGKSMALYEVDWVLLDEGELFGVEDTPEIPAW